MLEQTVIDRAVNIATKASQDGHPVERVIWIPPQSAGEDPCGGFAIILCDGLGASDIPPRERS